MHVLPDGDVTSTTTAPKTSTEGSTEDLVHHPHIGHNSIDAEENEDDDLVPLALGFKKAPRWLELAYARNPFTTAKDFPKIDDVNSVGHFHVPHVRIHVPEIEI